MANFYLRKLVKQSLSNVVLSHISMYQQRRGEVVKVHRAQDVSFQRKWGLTFRFFCLLVRPSAHERHPQV